MQDDLPWPKLDEFSLIVKASNVILLLCWRLCLQYYFWLAKNFSLVFSVCMIGWKSGCISRRPHHCFRNHAQLWWRNILNTSARSPNIAVCWGFPMAQISTCSSTSVGLSPRSAWSRDGEQGTSWVRFTSQDWSRNDFDSHSFLPMQQWPFWKTTYISPSYFSLVRHQKWVRHTHSLEMLFHNF